MVKAEAAFYYDKLDYELLLEICSMANPISEEEANQFNIIRPQKVSQLLENIRKKTRYKSC